MTADPHLAIDIGRRVRNIRRGAGMTQLALARAIDMRPGPLNNIEQGRNAPSAATIIALAHALCCTPNDILLPNGVATPAATARAREQQPRTAKRTARAISLLRKALAALTEDPATDADPGKS